MPRTRFHAAGAAILATILAAGCAAVEGGGQNPEGRWQATAIGGDAIGGPVPTTFELADEGAVAGKGGCNSYFGQATIDGDAMSFGPMGSTKMACAPDLMEQETAFFAAMESVEAWRIDGGELVLLDATGGEAVRLRAMDESAAISIDVPGTIGAATRQTVTYDCAGRPVEAEYINAGNVSLAALTIGDEFVVAASVIAASGARYAGGPFVWWTKGDEATLIDYMNGGTDAAITCRRAG